MISKSHHQSDAMRDDHDQFTDRNTYHLTSTIDTKRQIQLFQIIIFIIINTD